MRIKKFLENKRKSSPLESTSQDPSNTSEQSLPEDIHEEIEETLDETMESESVSQETEIEPVLEARNNLSKVPVILKTKDNVKEAPETSDKIANESGNNTEANFSPSTSEIEIRILICAADRAAAQKRCSQFPRSRIVGPHSSDKLHHFMLSAYVNDEYVTKMITNINKFEDFLMFRVVYKKQSHYPDENQKNHCQECQYIPKK